MKLQMMAIATVIDGLDADESLKASPRTVGGSFVLALSRRNLLALTSKLDQPESQRTIFKDIKFNGAEWRVIVVGEDDDKHYGDKPAGEMSEATEEFIKAHGGRGPLAERLAQIDIAKDSTPGTK